MKVQSITNYQFNLKNYNKSNLNENPEQKLENNIISIYNKGINPIVFRSLANVTTSFSKEIAEQPEVIRNLLNKFFANPNKITNIPINFTEKMLNKMTAPFDVHIVASGSSKNAGEMAKKFIERIIGSPVNIHSASEFMTTAPKINHQDLMIFVSQSGNTADTFEALNYAKKNNITSIALTNNENSKIAKGADFSVNIGVGEEKAVAATKTVTGTIVNLWGIALRVAELINPKSFNKTDFVRELNRLPDLIEKMINDKKAVEAIAEKHANVENIYILAKEPNLGAANEGALKLTETTQKRVISGSSSEFMHGLFTSMKENDLYVQIATGHNTDKTALMSKENFNEIVNKRNLTKTVMIKTEGMKDEANAGDYITVPNTLSDFTPLLNTIRLQQLTEAFTTKLKINPDNGGGVLTKFRDNLTMGKK